jgi:small-conductance mechanosensitive channel
MDVLSSETLRELASTVYLYLTQPLFTLGDASFSIATLLKLTFFFVLFALAAGALRRFLSRRLLPRLHIERGLAYALSNIVFYILITLGLFISLEATGVDLSSITVLFGALGVGVGFGLQTIVSNFVSGLILLLERPIQVGDHIEMGNLHGTVTRIRMRATEVLTNDNIAVIVPNNELTGQQVINWSRGDDTMRVRIPIGVAYGSDVKKVVQALMDAADEVPEMLKQPKPQVRLTGFGDSSLNFELLGWTRELLTRRGFFISRVNYAIHDALEKHGIEIPFPQRDLHLKTATPLAVGPPADHDKAGSGRAHPG